MCFCTKSPSSSPQRSCSPMPYACWIVWVFEANLTYSYSIENNIDSNTTTVSWLDSVRLFNLQWQYHQCSVRSSGEVTLVKGWKRDLISLYRVTYQDNIIGIIWEGNMTKSRHTGRNKHNMLRYIHWMCKTGNTQTCNWYSIFQLGVTVNTLGLCIFTGLTIRFDSDYPVTVSFRFDIPMHHEAFTIHTNALHPQCSILLHMASFSSMNTCSKYIWTLFLLFRKCSRNQ